MGKKPARGAPLIEAAIGKLEKKLGKPKPLDESQLRACEEAAGVALSPSLFALLSFDAGMMKRDYRWFDGAMKLLAKPTIEVIGEHAGPFREMYEPLCEARFPGNAIALDQGSDSMRFLYFGDPDDHGEYPVLYIDHDDMPILGVEFPGFDAWLAEVAGVPHPDWSKASTARCNAMLGTAIWDIQDDPGEYPDPVPGPAPGSVAHTAKKVSSKKKEKKLTDKQLDKALAEAAEEGDADALGSLAEDAKRRKRKKALDDALVMATRARSAECVRILLAAGAKPKAKGYYGCTLSDAVSGDDAVTLTKILVEAGADPNGPSINGQTVMHSAVEHGSLDVVRMLLEAGGDANREDDNGMTPLHVAAMRSVGAPPPPPEMIDLLIDHGARVEGGSSHSSVLAWAIDDGLHEHVARLIARGAKMTSKSDQGRAPLHIAYERNDDAMLVSLLAAGADRRTKDDRGISFEEIYGSKGEDIRPIEAHYTASSKTQTLTIDARMAVLNHHHVGQSAIRLGAAGWVSLVNAGLAAGSEFDPTTSSAKVIEEPVWAKVKKDGFIELRWVLEVAAVSPLFLEVLGQRILGGAGAFTGAGVMSVLRGVSLKAHGSLDPRPVPLRAWMTDPSAHLGEWTAPLPFGFETAIGPSRVLVVAKDGKTLEHWGDFHNLLFQWFEMASVWPRTGVGGAMLNAPTQKDGGAFSIVGFVPPDGKRTRRWPFTTEAPILALRNALRVLHAKVPIERVVLTMETESASPEDA